VDTTAAMAGAICGARVGISGIPEVLRKRIHDQDLYTADDLVQISLSAYQLMASGEVSYLDPQ
jgi:ADP-ribosylglycohydrolase